MLSKRLKAVAHMVTPNNIVADIGTDHGYVPIYLTKNNICPRAYAMDVNVGPINSAKRNIALEGLNDKVETILSDGLEKFQKGMAQSVIIAGMGGELIVSILKKSEHIDSIEELILSPHKNIDLVRKYLHSIGWKIIKEEMIEDANKFYTIIKAVKGQDLAYSEVEYVYGKLLLDTKHPVLKEYLDKEHSKFTKIKNDLLKNSSQNVAEVNQVLALNKKGLDKYD